MFPIAIIDLGSNTIVLEVYNQKKKPFIMNLYRHI